MPRFTLRLALCVFAVLLGVILTRPQPVYANSVCTDNPVACVMMWIPWTHTIESTQGCTTDAYGIRTCPTIQVTDMVERCTIPQAGGGSCQCCYETGCYLDCGNIPGTGGGGGGNTDPPPDPGVTLTPTPTPAPGTINIVAREVTNDTTCTAISNSIDPVVGTIFGFTPSSASSPSPQTQLDNTPVSFTNLPIGSYTITYTPPAPEWILANACIYRNGVLTAYGQNADLFSGNTLEWRIGFTRGSAWVQTSGGDVYAASSVRSYIPNVSPRVFNANGSNGYPGVVTYGTSYDFDPDWTLTGSTYVSSSNWIVQETQAPVDYYDFFYRRYGSPTIPTTNSAFGNLLAVTKPATSVTPYYVLGDMTTSGNWIVGSNESIVILVDGNLTIGGNINITGNGFIAFIVNGDITISDAIGTTVSSVAPVVEGVYITNTTGTFATGASLAASTAKFVGNGMFVAGNFLLERDLEISGGNTTYPAALFTFDPQLLLTMPDSMKDLPVTWQEVAP